MNDDEVSDWTLSPFWYMLYYTLEYLKKHTHTIYALNNFFQEATDAV